MGRKRFALRVRALRVRVRALRVRGRGRARARVGALTWSYLHLLSRL